MSGLRERPFEWWAARAEAEEEGPVAAGRAALAEMALRREAVLTHLVAPRLARLEQPANAVDRVTNAMVGLMQAELRERRQVLGDHAFVACMIEEIAARVVALEAMVAGG